MRTGNATLPKFVKVFPHEYKRVLGIPRVPRGRARRASRKTVRRAGDPWVRSPASRNTRARLPTRRPVDERVNDYFEVYQPFPEEKVRTQAARCMDCGIPFCHTGCPVNNIIPDWNDLVYRDQWKEAIRVLHSTNNFPEFTGRICPAPCEAACVLGINEPPVTIKVIEKTIVEHAWKEGWIKPEPPETRTGKRVAVVGSGPAGLAAAQQLNRAGHSVTVFEKADRIGGLLRYGIPDFKMEKTCPRPAPRADGWPRASSFRRTRTSAATFPPKICARNLTPCCSSGGAEHPRDLNVPGRELKGIHFAMEFLPQQNKRNAGDHVPGSDSRHRQARGDHRRRRHRRGLPGHLPPAEGQVRPPVRNHAHAAAGARRQHAVAAVAAAAAHRKRARRRRHARLGRSTPRSSPATRTAT